MRDIRKKNWFWIENDLVDRKDLTFEEKAMYMFLIRFDAVEDTNRFPVINKLEELTGKDQGTIVKYLKKLNEKGLF